MQPQMVEAMLLISISSSRIADMSEGCEWREMQTIWKKVITWVLGLTLYGQQGGGTEKHVYITVR